MEDGFDSRRRGPCTFHLGGKRSFISSPVLLKLTQPQTRSVGPSDRIHSYEAAGFVVRLFFEHFLQSMGWADAFRHTTKATSTFSTEFQCWQNGVRT